MTSTPQVKRVKMEAESYALAEAWDILCFCNVNVESSSKKDAWIVDAAAD